MSRLPKTGQNQNIRIANESSADVAKFKYLGTTLTHQKDISDKINACYYSIKNLLSSRLISKKKKKNKE
jgi:hypothetical protein